MIPPREIVADIWSDSIDKLESKAKNLKGLISRFNGTIGFSQKQRLIINETNGYGINPIYNIQTDMMLLDRYYEARLQATTKLSRIELLEKGIALYKGKVLPEASHEFWLLDTEIYYHQKYLNMVNELLKLLDEQKEYQYVIQYALQSLKIAPENSDAYF